MKNVVFLSPNFPENYWNFCRELKNNGLRVLGIGVVLYWLYGLISAYCKGGPDAPSLTVLLAGIVLLGGGAILVSILTWKAWKIEQAAVTKEDDTDEDA